MPFTSCLRLIESRFSITNCQKHRYNNQQYFPIHFIPPLKDVAKKLLSSMTKSLSILLFILNLPAESASLQLAKCFHVVSYIVFHNIYLCLKIILNYFLRLSKNLNNLYIVFKATSFNNILMKKYSRRCNKFQAYILSMRIFNKVKQNITLGLNLL